jgi:hypothetical protein
MKTKVTVKTKIVVNGKEYNSLAELPAALRAAYEKAMAPGAEARQTSRLPEPGAPSPVLPQDLGAAIEPGGSQRIRTGLLIAAALLALLYWMYGR